MKKTIIIFAVLTKIFGQSNHKNLIIDLTDKNGKNYNNVAILSVEDKTFLKIINSRGSSVARSVDINDIQSIRIRERKYGILNNFVGLIGLSSTGYAIATYSGSDGNVMSNHIGIGAGLFFIHKSLSGIAFNSPNEIDLGNILISDKISFFETIIAYETRNSNSLETKIEDMYAIGSNNDTQMLQRNKKVKYAVYIGGACVTLSVLVLALVPPSYWLPRF